ncbi:MAG: GTPase HflX [Bacteroidales bacterium]|jgi:GTP-binding protein HflX|nr:GTPase HflX [Bacteroidales bacterium]MDD3666086.1 GTPase HflX [Bacteroidales bacterium]
MIETSKITEKAVIIGLITPGCPEDKTTEYLDELEFLVDTAGASVVRRFVQRLSAPDSRTFLGSGKLAEVAAFISDNQIGMAVFDDELSASQFRNVEKILGCKVLDRNNLILDIFASRARTAHARTQVELAQYQYLLPRLTRLWTHLEKQRGGIGMRGPGEKEIETDRRIIRDRIAFLKEKLRDIDKISTTQRKSRGQLIRVALVGYTNVGKSTLMNLLSKSDVFAENKLFATLDTTVRKVVIGATPFLLSDTVGFIRKLPHTLVESFKSTLDEVREADLLLHVADVSHTGIEEQVAVVEQTLREIGAGDKPVVMVFNKTDLLPPPPADDEIIDFTASRLPSPEEFKNSWLARDKGPAVFISAANRTDTDQLKQLILEQVTDLYQVRYPYATGFPGIA